MMLPYCSQSCLVSLPKAKIFDPVHRFDFCGFHPVAVSAYILCMPRFLQNIANCIPKCFVFHFAIEGCQIISL
eukprot:Skav204099  [mRNA]  locus=scaffold1472:64648:64866:- [translate_table: standard]